MLGHNAIEVLEGLESLVQLNTLDLTSNRVKTLTGLNTLKSLEELWMGYNLVDSFDAVAALDAKAVQLKTIYLEHNPISRDFNYRKQLKVIHPTLTQIDSSYVH